MAKVKQKREGTVTKVPASLCWFEVPADDIAQAKNILWRALSGGRFAKIPTVIQDYWHIDTAGKDASPDGGLMPRMYPGQGITNYVAVPSVNRAVAKVEKLGGSVCKTKTEVPGMGYLAVCEDTEGNTFALWEPMLRTPRKSPRARSSKGRS